MKLLGNILLIIAGALAGALAIKIVQEKADEPNQWQNAWNHSSAPLDPRLSVASEHAGN
jgi:hypothetical protein